MTATLRMLQVPPRHGEETRWLLYDDRGRLGYAAKMPSRGRCFPAYWLAFNLADQPLERRALGGGVEPAIFATRKAAAGEVEKGEASLYAPGRVRRLEAQEQTNRA